MRSFRTGQFVAAALALVPGWALAQHEHDHMHVAPEKLGQVRFPTSCKPEVQSAFERGLALLHSFAYGKAATVFQEVSAKDPGCGLAEWGVAMTYFHTATLTGSQASLQGQKGFDWATPVEIQRRAAAAWLARAEKKDAEALTLMRSAADLDDSTDKHPVTPGPILPAREQLADLLAEVGQPAAALAEYEASLRAAPGRLNSYDGAARAAERAGKKQEAKAFRDRLVALCGGSVPDRLSLARTAAQ